MGLSLDFLTCFIDLCVCFCASTILFWLLKFCSIVWSQEAWFLQLHFSFSRQLWLFKVFCVSIQIVKMFALILWKIPLVIYSDCIESVDCFGEYSHFHIDASYQEHDIFLSICLCHHWFLSSISYSYLSTGLLPP